MDNRKKLQESSINTILEVTNTIKKWATETQSSIYYIMAFELLRVIDPETMFFKVIPSPEKKETVNTKDVSLKLFKQNPTIKNESIYEMAQKLFQLTQEEHNFTFEAKQYLYKNIFDLYCHAALKGNLAAKNQLKMFEENNEIQTILGNYHKYIGRDKEKIIYWLGKAARDNYSEAQYGLATHYDYGEKDYGMAVYWYQMAANNNHLGAKNDLAVCHKQGLGGLRVDYKKAFELYSAAAEGGDSTAKDNLAICYEKGEGTNADQSKAVEWFRKSAEDGYSFGQCNYALCFLNGRGVKKSNPTAFKWFTKAAEQNNSIATHNLGPMLQKQKIFQEICKSMEEELVTTWMPGNNTYLIPPKQRRIFANIFQQNEKALKMKEIIKSIKVEDFEDPNKTTPFHIPPIREIIELYAGCLTASEIEKIRKRDFPSPEEKLDKTSQFTLRK